MTRQETEAFIADQLSRLSSHDDWLKTLRISSRFHRYSFRNRFLIALQNSEASFVAGFQTWKEMGRHVNKGEKGIRILAPLVKKVADEDDPDVKTPRVIGFRTVSVFDVDQTSGEPFDPPSPTLLTSQDHVQNLHQLLAASPVPVTFVEADTLHGANGVYYLDSPRIEIRNDMAADQQLKTLAHELSHHFGTHDADQRLPRDWEECAAESSAFVLCGLWGLDSLEYSAAYVAGWSGADSDVIRHLTESVADRVDAVASLLATTQPAEAA